VTHINGDPSMWNKRGRDKKRTGQGRVSKTGHVHFTFPRGGLKEGFFIPMLGGGGAISCG